ncbi:Seh1p [Sugiyamaella lignohabitans]|uniref:Seh1p n=1 Tax=Sugiyamaella lignohabitans TaxID=796027 RepID=A0A167DQV2_9ASCO|nr:Seh1p [Sugiyamaella lignohabitans]ANB13182.1 Seh1p [Sugiyamaella lignohabitans]
MAFWTTSVEVNMLTNPVARQLQSSFALSWCPSMFFKEYIVACVLEDAFIYQRDHLGKYVRVAQLTEHKGLIRDVAWAPSMGRGYQLIATASKDGYVRIFKITSDTNGADTLSLTASALDDDNDDDDESSPPRAPANLKVELLSQFDDHHGEVWRVSWNLTGKCFNEAGCASGGWGSAPDPVAPASQEIAGTVGARLERSERSRGVWGAAPATGGMPVRGRD